MLIAARALHDHHRGGINPLTAGKQSVIYSQVSELMCYSLVLHFIM